MGVMPFLKKHWIKAISVGGFILALLGWFEIEPDSFKKTFIWLFDNFFKVLIVIILMWLIVITIKLRKLLKADITNLRDDFEKHKEVNSNIESELGETITKIRTDLNYVYRRYEKYERLEPDNEIRFILELVADQLDERLKKSEIEKCYFNAFKNKKQYNFNSVFNLIMTKDFLEKLTEGYGGSYGPLAHKITNKGYDYLRCREIDDKENKKLKK